MMTSHFKGVVKMPRRFFSATAALGTLALLAGTMLSSATSANELTGKGKRAPDARPTVILQRLAVPKRTRQSGPGMYKTMNGGSTWTNVARP